MKSNSYCRTSNILSDCCDVEPMALPGQGRCCWYWMYETYIANIKTLRSNWQWLIDENFVQHEKHHHKSASRILLFRVLFHSCKHRNESKMKAFCTERHCKSLISKDRPRKLCGDRTLATLAMVFFQENGDIYRNIGVFEIGQCVNRIGVAITIAIIRLPSPISWCPNEYGS